ncbi:MAG: site-specific integrase [Lachnospiraceae bacterium]|nr:site-specific integrase [Lachnospiraceae bacterium]
MAKVSVRKKGKKWYYRFSVRDSSGKLIDVERAGTVDKNKTKRLGKQALTEYQQDGIILNPRKFTVGQVLDKWFEFRCQSYIGAGTKSDYKNAIRRIKSHPLGDTLMLTASTNPELIQKYVDDQLDPPEDSNVRPLKHTSLKASFVVLNGAFKYAEHPLKLVKNNPMPHVNRRHPEETFDVFSMDFEEEEIKIISIPDYKKLIDRFNGTIHLLPIQISFYTGMREGEIAALTWNDIDMKNRKIKIFKSMFYNTEEKMWELGPTKGKRKRIINFGDSLYKILMEARKNQLRHHMEYGELWNTVLYKRKRIDGMIHTQLEIANSKDLAYHPDYYKDMIPLDFVCKKEDGSLHTTQTIKYSNKAAKKIPGMDYYHFHLLRHTHATILLSNGANEKAVQERLGHSKKEITTNTYYHATQSARKEALHIAEMTEINEMALT